MRTFACHALSIGAAAALLAGCGAPRQAQDGTQPPIAAAGALPQTSKAAPARVGPIRRASAYQVLYRFKLEHGVGSGLPMGRLLNAGGTFYGTTQLGGMLGGGGCCGTVYSVTPTGTYNTVYAFRGAKNGDGAGPRAGLIFGTYGTGLYGTTASGGTSNLGTVYNITTSGVEKVLHSFSGGSDGAYPASDLFSYNGTIYGTTRYGGGTACGGRGCGTIYTITASGVETVLYAFKGGTDGETPSSGLIIWTSDAAPPRTLPRAMYGTTRYGGGTGCGGSGCGTVYSILTNGQQEKVVYSFAGGADGSEPNGLDDDRGTLFGTTVAGGTGCKGSVGCGTVYRLTGGKQVVYNFRGGSDGACPHGPLIDLVGYLYGTTACGGGCSTEPCGTVYVLSTSGTERVLYRFTNSADGFSPNAPLTNINTTLYGTTTQGGGSGKGYGRGVVYSVIR
jgi:uncharacterized repeat protein (TIGR03803 family)